jgi:hypothetical protein
MSFAKISASVVTFGIVLVSTVSGAFALDNTVRVSAGCSSFKSETVTYTNGSVKEYVNTRFTDNADLGGGNNKYVTGTSSSENIQNYSSTNNTHRVGNNVETSVSVIVQ